MFYPSALRMFGDFRLTSLVSVVAIIKYTYRDRTPFEGNDVIGGYQGKRLLFPENVKCCKNVFYTRLPSCEHESVDLHFVPRPLPEELGIDHEAIASYCQFTTKT